MDLETENRIAQILLKEAAELRRRAEEEGVGVYLCQPKVRGRPNSRFLTSTVLGVQQANRAVEENEMWRARQKQLDLDKRLRGKLSDKSQYGESYRSCRDSGRISKRHSDVDTDVSVSPSCSSRKRDDEGLRDDEVEQFLQSRIKRGRGAVGSRMDETGPYLPSNPDTKGKPLTSIDVNHREGPEKRVVLGPEKPKSFWRSDTSEDDSSVDHKKKTRTSSMKPCSRKHRSKDKSRDKEKKKRKRSKEKSRKHCK